jgi:Rab5 GDP/GTP exchange factor
MELPSHDRPIASILLDQTSQTPVNPWTDSADFDDKNPQSTIEHIPLRTPDPELLDQSIIAGIKADESPIDTVHPKVSNDILSQFDPLASLEEEAARDAWNNSESHPPPPRPPSPSPPPVKDTAEPPTTESSPRQPSGPSSFPSLAALARTFALPTLSRSRPVSIDAPKTTPSPTTLSSFEAQQNASQDDNTTTKHNDPTIPPSSQSGNGVPSSAAGGKESDDIPFDFQKFLDQMKSRGAEPVSKYLRSCVIFAILSL